MYAPQLRDCLVTKYSYYQVRVDTGSSDLWIDPSGLHISDTIDTGVSATIQYE